MNQKLENNQPGVVIKNPAGTLDIDVNYDENYIEKPAQDLKHPDKNNSHIPPHGKTISDEMSGMMDKVLALLNDYEITVEDKKQILKGAIERLN
jgi:hypothetical protein